MMSKSAGKCDAMASHRVAANKLRRRMSRDGTLVVRLISSPGSGKTNLLEKTALALGRSHAMAVLVGDVESDLDARRLKPFFPTIQITTGDKCHIEFPLIERALQQLGERPLDILFIEDIGNLVCAPAHDLGEHLRVLLLSPTEGEDKPGKFAKAFRTSDVLMITKTDLLPYVPFDMKHVEHAARGVQPGLKILQVSAHTGVGLEGWAEFLRREHQRLLAARKTDSRKVDTRATSPAKKTRPAPPKGSNTRQKSSAAVKKRAVHVDD